MSHRKRIVFALVLIFLLAESRILVLRFPFRITSTIVGELIVALTLTTVLFVLSWLGIIAVTGLQQRVLVAMTALTCHRYIGRLVGAVLFDGAFPGIFVACFMILCQLFLQLIPAARRVS